MEKKKDCLVFEKFREKCKENKIIKKIKKYKAKENKK